MVTPNTLLGLLPAFCGNQEIISKRQTTKKIMTEVLDAHIAFESDYDRIEKYFVSVNPAADLFNFCKKYLHYNIESDKWQSTRSPSGIIALGETSIGVDCKHYAGFIGGVLGALNRKNKNIDWCYRFASYDNDTIPGHVFIVIFDDYGNETWIDPVLDSLNCRYPYPDYIIDKKPSAMPLIRLSGVSKNSVGAIPAPYQNMTSAQFNAALASGAISLTPAQVLTALGGGAGNIQAQTNAFLSKATMVETASDQLYNNSALQTAWNQVNSTQGNAKQGAIVRYYLSEAANSFGFSLNPATFNITYFQAWLELNHNFIYQIIAKANSLLGKADAQSFLSQASAVLSSVTNAVVAVGSGNISSAAGDLINAAGVVQGGGKAIDQGTLTTVSNLGTELNSALAPASAASTLSSSKVVTWIKANPLLSLLIGGAIGFGIYEIAKD